MSLSLSASFNSPFCINTLKPFNFIIAVAGIILLEDGQFVGNYELQSSVVYLLGVWEQDIPHYFHNCFVNVLVAVEVIATG